MRIPFASPNLDVDKVPAAFEADDRSAFLNRCAHFSRGVEQPNVELPSRHDIPVRWESVAATIKGNRVAVGDALPEKNRHMSDRQVRRPRERSRTIHRLNEAKSARFDEVAANLLPGKGLAIEHDHPRAASRQA